MPKPAQRSRKSRSAREILAHHARCIYCPNAADTVEHMPSKALFRAKDRPSGLEFPSCKDCNNRTSAADSLVAFLARIHKHHDDPDGWQVREGIKYLLAAEQGARGLVREFFADDNARDTLMETPGGVLVPVAEMHAGPIARALLDVWAAKLAMALYHEHAGSALPPDGGTYAIWFLNNGLDQPTGDNFLRILPAHGTLVQGRRKSASGQFDYRFNTDERSIVAALTHFHGNIHFFTIAMADPAAYHFPRDRLPHGRFMRPGDLLASMPKPPPAILMPAMPLTAASTVSPPPRVRPPSRIIVPPRVAGP